MNQWWLVYWCIYASLSLNELNILQKPKWNSWYHDDILTWKHQYWPLMRGIYWLITLLNGQKCKVLMIFCSQHEQIVTRPKRVKEIHRHRHVSYSDRADDVFVQNTELMTQNLRSYPVRYSWAQFLQTGLEPENLLGYLNHINITPPTLGQWIHLGVNARELLVYMIMSELHFYCFCNKIHQTIMIEES